MKKQLIVIFVVLLMLSQINAIGLNNELYVTRWRNVGVAALKGTSAIRSWGSSGTDEIAIAVNGTIKTFGWHTSGGSGAEYNLNGTYTGTQYSLNPISYQFDDGTTDGTYNYAWGHGTNTLEKFDSNWNHIERVFSLTGTARLGVTYDPTDDTFWLSSWGNYQVEHYNRSGTLLETFATDRYTGALALDHTDNTLWLNVQATSTFKQYTKSGSLLQTLNVSGLTGSIYGGEFDFALSGAVPEPGTFILVMLLCCAALINKKN